MRILPEDELDKSEYHQAQLRFDDGGMRGLAAALCWCGLIYHVGAMPPTDFAIPSVLELARGLLHIPTYFKARGQDDAAAMISRIIKQNVNSKVLSVSSYEWSQILQSMAKAGESITVNEAIEMYNGSAEVAAHGGTSSKDRGSGQFSSKKTLFCCGFQQNKRWQAGQVW